MRKGIVALGLAAMMLTGVVAAPAAQAADYSWTENKMWRMMKSLDKKAAKWGGKKDSIEMGYLACEEFDRRGMRRGLSYIYNSLRESDMSETTHGENWVLLSTFMATRTLCPEYKKPLEKELDRRDAS